MDLEENMNFMLEGCMGQRYSTKQRADKKRNGVAVVEFWPRDYVAAVAEAPSPARRPAAGKDQQPAAIEDERAGENDRKGGRSGSGRRQTAGRQFNIGIATATRQSRGRMER